MNFSHARVEAVCLSSLYHTETGGQVSHRRCATSKEAEENLLGHLSSVVNRRSVEYLLPMSADSQYERIQAFWRGDGSLEEVHREYTDRLVSCYDRHPQIKDGELMCMRVEDIQRDDELVNAIVLVKLEDPQSFIKVNHQEAGSSVIIDEGYLTGKMGKVSVMLEMETEEGYEVISASESTRPDASYWITDVLSLQPAEATYQPTQQYIDLAKTFIDEHISQEPQVNQAEKHGVLYDAGEFFKKHQQYDDKTWQQEILENKPERIEAWDQHKETYSQRTGETLPDNFGISNLAVKQNNKYFKSVLKLDKNFHVYIHGDRNQIEHGRELDGRKYYKLYYEEEK